MFEEGIGNHYEQIVGSTPIQIFSAKPSRELPDMDNIRIMIVDDHTVVRDGLSSMLGWHDEFLIAGEARNGVEAVETYKELQPDIVSSRHEKIKVLTGQLGTLPVAGQSLDEPVSDGRGHGAGYEPTNLARAIGSNHKSPWRLPEIRNPTASGNSTDHKVEAGPK